MLRITGGKVYDPAHGIHGEIRDICIADGRIVADVPGGQILNAAGMVILPGGVDIHTHVAGSALNFSRVMTPENQRTAQAFLQTKLCRTGIGGPTPTTFATGYLYAGMGYTTVMEAAVPVLSARHTHEELNDTPILDKGCNVLLANNEILLDLLERGDLSQARDVVAWLVWAAKAYGVKAVNPGGVAAWKHGGDAKTLHAPILGYHKVTAGQIIQSLAQIIDDLGLPHAMHLHCNNLGAPGNFETTLETMRLLEGNRAHIAHLQYHAYGGDDWHTMHSKSRVIADYFNAHPNLTCDAGAVLFGNAVTITADGPWQHLLYQLTGRKWGNLDVENETGCGIVPYSYKGSNLVNAVQWAVGLELLLLINDPWRVFLTTDHPNGACFWRYPEIIHMLMDREFRREQIAKLPEKALAKTIIAELDREYTLSEIAILTSAGPARALGMKAKGHLGIGADADIAIYHDKPDGRFLFRYPRYVLKGGEIVVEEGDIRLLKPGREFVVRPVYDPRIEHYLKPVFQDLYTVQFENYPVALNHLEHSLVQTLSPGKPSA